MTEHTFERLVLRDDVYSDAAVITNERGFKVIEVALVAILAQYNDKLNINHWADDKRAYTEFTQEQQAANARRIVACVNFCSGISTENLETNEPLVWLLKQYNSVKAALHNQEAAEANDLSNESYAGKAVYIKGSRGGMAQYFRRDGVAATGLSTGHDSEQSAQGSDLHDQ